MKIELIKNKKSKTTYHINTDKLKKLVNFTEENGREEPYKDICKDNVSFEIECYESDYECLINSQLEIIMEDNTSILLIKSKNDNNKTLIKFGTFQLLSTTNKQEKTIYKGNLNFISNDFLIEGNIIKKDDELNSKIKGHFERVIGKMDVSDSLKETYIGFFKNTKNIHNITPILYFNEETNAMQWYIPNFSGNKDYFFDYLTQIPILSANNKIITNNNLYFTILNKDNLDCYSKNDENNDTLKYSSEKFNNNDFYFNSNFKEENAKVYNGNELFNSYMFFNNENKTNKIYTMYLPTIQTLEEEETLNFLNLCKSNYKIEDIKEQIKKYEYISDDILPNEEVEFNIPFISKKYKIYNKTSYDNDIDETSFYSGLSEFNFLKSKNFYLSNFTINSKNILYSNIELQKDYYSSFITKKSKKNNDYLYLKTKKMEVFLPKYKDSVINNEVNNFGKIFKIFLSDKTFLIFEDNKIIVTKKDSYNSIIFETDCKNFKLKEKKSEIQGKKSYKAFITGKNKDLFLLQNENNDIYLLDLKAEEFLLLENSKTLNKLSEEFIGLLNLEKKFNNVINFDVFVTDNGLKYFQNQIPFKRNIEINQEIIPLEYYETKINNEKRTYTYKTKIPLEFKEEKLLYKKNRGLGSDMFLYNIKKEEIKIVQEKNNHPDVFKIIEVEYEFNENFFNLDNDLKDYLEQVKTKRIEKINESEFYYKNNMDVSIKHYKNFELYLVSMSINGIKYNKNEALNFLNKFSLIKEKEFIIENENECVSISMVDKSKLAEKNIYNKKYLLLHNKKDKKNLSIYDEKKPSTTAIIKKFKNNELLGQINYNVKLNNYIILLKNKMLLFKSFKDIVNFNVLLKPNIDNKNSMINDSNSLNFYNEKNELMSLELDDNKEIKKVVNIDGLKTINNKLKDISNSFF